MEQQYTSDNIAAMQAMLSSLDSVQPVLAAPQQELLAAPTSPTTKPPWKRKSPENNWSTDQQHDPLAFEDVDAMLDDVRRQEEQLAARKQSLEESKRLQQQRETMVSKIESQIEDVDVEIYDAHTVRAHKAAELAKCDQVVHDLEMQAGELRVMLADARSCVTNRSGPAARVFVDAATNIQSQACEGGTEVGPSWTPDAGDQWCAGEQQGQAWQDGSEWGDGGVERDHTSWPTNDDWQEGENSWAAHGGADDGQAGGGGEGEEGAAQPKKRIRGQRGGLNNPNVQWHTRRHRAYAAGPAAVAHFYDNDPKP